MELHPGLQQRQQQSVATMVLSLGSHVLLASVKWIAGVYGHSYALIADAIESTTDILTATLVIAGLAYAHRPADKNHPYGHGRLEPLITFLVVALLVISATIILYQSVLNILTPHEMPRSFTLWVLAPLILWKEASYQWVMYRSRQTKSSVLKAEAWHHRSDAITSVAAFIGISLALILGPGYEAADDWTAILASGFIFYNAFRIFQPAFREVMDEDVYGELVQDIRRVALQVDGIRGTEKCFVRKSGMVFHIDLHALVDGHLSVTEGHTLAHQLKDKLRSELPALGHVLIHIEPSPTDAAGNPLL